MRGIAGDGVIGEHAVAGIDCGGLGHVASGAVFLRVMGIVVATEAGGLGAVGAVWG